MSNAQTYVAPNGAKYTANVKGDLIEVIRDMNSATEAINLPIEEFQFNSSDIYMTWLYKKYSNIIKGVSFTEKGSLEVTVQHHYGGNNFGLDIKGRYSNVRGLFKEPRRTFLKGIKFPLMPSRA